MADYTDIDKLRDDELADAISLGDESWFWPVDGEKATVLDVLIDLQRSRAELVGLRTEVVDQLRTENNVLFASLGRVEAEVFGTDWTGIDGPTMKSRLGEVLARQGFDGGTGILASVTAERDALQAEVERMRGKDDVALNRAAERDVARLEVAALQARIDAALALHRENPGSIKICVHCHDSWPCGTVAALGVDPQA